MDSLTLTWNKIIELININLSQNNNGEYSLYLEDSKLRSFENNKAIITTPLYINKIILNDKNFIDIIKKSFFQYTQCNVDVQVLDDNEYGFDTLKNDYSEAIVNDLNDYLDESFTFENFIVGPSNREAKTAALACSIEPARKEYNPLVIYGDSGLGKTHLLHSIGNRIKKNTPETRILYKSALDFVNEVVKSTKDNTIDEYKSQLYSLDLLLVDDIQLLSNKPKCNEVFFAIYNELINNRKQIVLTCDRPPTEIKDVEERLKTRFSQGLSVTITAPEVETAYQIVKQKMKSLSIDNDAISNEVVSYIATNFNSDVRNLEGALNRILFYSINFCNGQRVELSNALEAFKGQVNENNNTKELTIKDIISAVCDYYSLTRSQLMSKNRTKNIANARHIAMYLCRKHLDVSYLKIGEEFGGKDHSTVLSACEKIENYLKTNEIYRSIIYDIEKKINKN